METRNELPVYVSLGAGVQSSTLSLMLAAGEVPGVPAPRGAIFADTMAEPAEVYRWLDWLEAQLPFPVYRVSAGSLEDANLRVRVSKRNGLPYMKHFVPTFTAEGGLMPRKCTTDFKLVPIHKALRRLAGVRRGTKVPVVASLIGISRDEAVRMKPSREPWVENRWPLVDLGMTRADCVAWMEAHGFPRPPRSACVFCPYHSDREWARLKKDDPGAFARAAGFERKLNGVAEAQGLSHGGEYLHRSCKPLETVDFRTDVEKGQGLLGAWGNECEGLCGV